MNDLLADHQAPEQIDYLSIDTEGSDFEILNAFDFSKHHVATITVEHGFTSSREKLQTLLEKNGFTRVLEGISDCDDWYVHRD